VAARPAREHPPAGRLLAAVALFGSTLLAAGVLPVARAGAVIPRANVPMVGVSSLAFAGDAPDPDIVRSGSTYYAFTTGTALGNNIQVLVDTTGSPASGFASLTGAPFGSTALPSPPAWETPGTQTSPGVFAYGGRWLMYYDAATGGRPGGTGNDCLSIATAPSLDPPRFTDTSSSPFLCQPALGGSIDPSPFVDPATGTAYLVWKSNDGGSLLPGIIWSAQLDASGTAIVGAPVQLTFNDTVNHPWETTVEDPDMVVVNGVYYLVFSGGDYASAGYAQGYAVCAGPLGPCVQPQPGPFLASSGSIAGPGGGSLFQDASGTWWIGYAAWTAGCTSYLCGGARRLYTAPMVFAPPPLNQPVVGLAPLSPPAPGTGYWEVARDGGIFSFGEARFFGSTGAIRLNQPVVGMAATTGAGGYWLVASDGGVFSFGEARFFGSTGAMRLNQPVVGMAATTDAGGYWLVASDGGIFAFGDAGFFGSTGAVQLNQPVVGMAVTPSGGGYWLVAADGGIFAFGDAGFFGSTGSLHLNQPVVGMAATPSGGGYWLVSSDGGIFAFGDAGFFGSTGGMHLNQPVVGMAATPSGGGYWLGAADGGIFAFGDAPFFPPPP
jgi:hypothetical protein